MVFFYARAGNSSGPTCSTAFSLGVTAINPSNGSVVWGPIIPPGCSDGFGDEGASVGRNGLIYAEGDWNACGNGRLVAFNAIDGSIKWDHGDCPGNNYSSPHPRQKPALNDNLNSLYFGSSYLCSVNMDTGVNNWSELGGNYIGEGGIAIDLQQNIYYGTNSGTNSGVNSNNIVRSYTSAGVFRWEQIVGVRGSKIMAIMQQFRAL